MPLVDRSILDAAFDGDDHARAGLVALFISTAGGTLGELAAAITAGDQPGVARLAHTLAGSCAAVGALRLSALAGQLCETPAGGLPADAIRTHSVLMRTFEMTAATFESAQPAAAGGRTAAGV